VLRRVATCVAALVLASAFIAFGTPGANATAESAPAWQQAIAALAVPGQGCFTASFPAVQWRSTACSRVHPKVPQRFGGSGSGRAESGAGTEQVGGCSDNSCDYAAQTAAPMTEADGTFPSVTCGASPCESGLFGNTGTAANNVYSLQLNTNYNLPATSSCSTAYIPSACTGWQQFIYDSKLKEIQVEPALLGYDNNCTGTFNSSDGAGNCYDENENATAVPQLTPQQLASESVKFSGQVGLVSGTLTDTVKLTISGATSYAATAPDSRVNLAGNWTESQFGLYGDRGGAEAKFVAGTDLKVNLVTHSGTTAAPQCVPFNSTGEYNNLYLQPAPTLGIGASPSMESEQNSNQPALPAACATARGIGDTHLETFNNLLYDFQSQGDFELVTTGPSSRTIGTAVTPSIFKPAAGFTVQERQVSGAPSWPNAAVNRAVAARVGTSDVAVCTAPARLEIDGRTVSLANGSKKALPDGASVALNGGVYLMRDGNGNFVQATVQSGSTPHVDVRVGLGQWPESIQGLLANAGNTDNAIESRSRIVLRAPFAFKQIYGLYGSSWLVPANQDLLSACNGKAGGVKYINPREPFYANNLPPKVAAAARAVCVADRVRVTSLLNACTVDVAVLGKQAATVYRALGAPAVWGLIGG